ncbi:MAG: hypothetical protein AMXMBFR84_40030 [Candidatus Hydrogenedentota bacterium]
MAAHPCRVSAGRIVIFMMTMFAAGRALGQVTGEGTITVYIQPAGANAQGARWTYVDPGGGEVWLTSGQSATAKIGNFTIRFNDVRDWNKPHPIPIVLTTQGTTQTGTYERSQLAKPENVTASQGLLQDSVRVQWIKQANVSHYRVFRADDNNLTQAVQIATVSTDFLVDDNPRPRAKQFDPGLPLGGFSMEPEFNHWKQSGGCGSSGSGTPQGTVNPRDDYFYWVQADVGGAQLSDAAYGYPRRAVAKADPDSAAALHPNSPGLASSATVGGAVCAALAVARRYRWAWSSPKK